jgi:5'-nucleotidase
MPISLRARLAVMAVVVVSVSCAGRNLPGAPAPAATQLVDVQLLGFNDFHGTLEPAGGTNGRIGTTDAGGVEFLATHVARLRATNPNTVVVGAGDLIGGSTLLSGMFHDEPTVEALSDLGLQISSVGNHEFDEGWEELLRMQKGGCHSVDGCQDNTPFAGARYEYLSANVAFDPARAGQEAVARSGWQPRGTGPQTLLPGYTIREVGGVRVGFIGLVVQSAADLVSPAGIRGLTFRSEVEAGNEAAAALVRQGVNAIVVLIHEGGDPPSGNDPNACGATGPIVDIAAGLSSAVDVIVSGHTHRSYICTMSGKLVTSAESYGRLVTDIDLQVDPRTGDVVSKRATNVIVTRDVPKDARATAVVERYRPFYTALGTKPVGTITAPIMRALNPARESALGDVIADALLEGSQIGGNAVAAFWNPGGIRADLIGQPATGDGPRQVLFADAFSVLPFGNRVMVMTYSGDAILRLLEQMFDNPMAGEDRMLQVSAGFSYTYDRARPKGQRIDAGSVTIAGRPLDRNARYRIAISDFLFNGGDAFTIAAEGTNPVDLGLDVDLFVDYIRKQAPVAPGPQNRIIRR